MWWKKKEILSKENMEYPFALEEGKLVQKQPAEWALVIRYLREYAEEKEASVYIPVTKNSFDSFNRFASACRYSREINRFMEAGYLCVEAQVKSNVIFVSYCLDEGCDAHDGGYGMESRKDITAILDWNGNFVESFTFEGGFNTNKETKTVELLIKLGISALDEQGRINARYEQTADKWHHKVFIRGVCGMFSFGCLKVPCLYKNIELLEELDDHKYSICVQTIEDRYGLYLPYSNKENIPAIYYSPFRVIGAGIVATTQQDGNEVRFEIGRESSCSWHVNQIG